MADQYARAERDSKKAAEDLMSVARGKSAAADFDFSNARGNREALETAKRENWTRGKRGKQ